MSHQILGDQKVTKKPSGGACGAYVALMWRLGCGAVLSQFRCKKLTRFAFSEQCGACLALIQGRWKCGAYTVSDKNWACQEPAIYVTHLLL